jgi:hypothetical protein
LTFSVLDEASSVSLSASESPPDLPSDTGAGQMLEECSLREKAREARSSGQLPLAKPDRRYGRRGSGKACAVCGVVVNQHGVELELEFDRPGIAQGLDRYHVHPPCFAAWELEGENLTASRLQVSAARDCEGPFTSRGTGAPDLP